MNYCIALLLFLSSAQCVAGDVLSRAMHSAYVPSLKAAYSLENGNSHSFIVSLAWDFDELFGSERLVAAVKIQNLERERHFLLQQFEETDDVIQD